MNKLFIIQSFYYSFAKCAISVQENGKETNNIEQNNKLAYNAGTLSRWQKLLVYAVPCIAIFDYITEEDWGGIVTLGVGVVRVKRRRQGRRRGQRFSLSLSPLLALTQANSLMILDFP